VRFIITVAIVLVACFGRTLLDPIPWWFWDPPGVEPDDDPSGSGT
jgi:hypothetical protein